MSESVEDDFIDLVGKESPKQPPHYTTWVPRSIDYIEDIEVPVEQSTREQDPLDQDEPDTSDEFYEPDEPDEPDEKESVLKQKLKELMKMLMILKGDQEMNEVPDDNQ